MSASEYQTSMATLVFVIVAYTLISIVTVCGNALTIFVIVKNKKMHDVTNYFISNLAIADIIIGLFVTPLHFQAAYMQRWIFPDIFCKIIPFAANLSMSVSILTLIAISIDRYYLILYPFKKKLKFKQCSILLITIWIVSCAMSVTKLYNHVILFVNDTSSARGGDPIKQCGIKNYELLDYETGVLFSTQYLLPLILIMFIYARIGYFLYFERASTSTVKPRTAKRRRALKMILVVVIVFMISWLPMQLFNILNFKLDFFAYYENIHILWFICYSFAISNSCYNVFIYGIFSSRFRKEYSKALSFLPCKWFKKYLHEPENGNSRRSSLANDEQQALNSSYSPPKKSLVLDRRRPSYEPQYVKRKSRNFEADSFRPELKTQFSTQNMAESVAGVSATSSLAISYTALPAKSNLSDV